jgi:molybdate transport system regulatory protein
MTPLTEVSRAQQDNDEPTLRMHLWLETKEGMFFGLGRVQLLLLVDKLGSLNKAAKAVGMSYRAAWGRIKRTEELLGEPLLAQARGRKGYELTPLARELMRQFSAWHEEVEMYALQRAAERLPWNIHSFATSGLPENIPPE